MIVKKFQAPTENEAIIKAKEELGVNAVVLNIKTLKQRGIFRIFKKDAVEITAALEEKEFIKNINSRKSQIKDSSNESTNDYVKNVEKNEILLENQKKDFEKNRQEKSIRQNPLSNNSTEINQGREFIENLDKIKKEEHKRNNNGSIDLRADEDIDLNDPKKIEQRLDALQKLMMDSNNKPKSYEDINLNTSKKREDKRISSRSQIINGNIYASDKNKEVENKEKSLSQDDANIVYSKSANERVLGLINNKLCDNEVEKKYVAEILKEIEDSLKKETEIDNILSAVYQKIILKLGKPRTITLSQKTKLVFFIGPTGVGKTTTIAKIASKFKLEKYAKVAFITSDTYRIAAVEQLNTYAAIIDCPVDVVYGPDELKDSLESFKNYDLVLVDTAGRSHKSKEQMDELRELINAAYEYSNDYDVEIYLTLSVTTKYKDLVNITKTYSDIKDWGVIFTKLDETCSLGNIINVKMLTDAPLSYTTSGQNVPNDIEVINQQFIAKQLLGGNS